MAYEVRDALSTASLMRQRLIDQINAMSTSERHIAQSSRDSLSSWLEDASGYFGEAIGRVLGRVIKWLRDL